MPQLSESAPIAGTFAHSRTEFTWLVDLLASKQEHEGFIAFVSTLEDSRRDLHGWEEIAAIIKALFSESEMTTSNLRADLKAATDRVRDLRGRHLY